MYGSHSGVLVMFELLNSLALDSIESSIDFRKQLAQERWKEGFNCPRCGCTKGYALQTRDIVECAGCKRQTSSTSGTAFHGIRRLVEFGKALKDFCLGNHISAAQYARNAGIDPGTAWTHLQKIRSVFASAPLETACVDVPCTIFKPALIKQSKEDELYCATSPKTCAQEIIAVTILNSSTESKAKLPASMIHSALSFLLSVFRGVSRKYSQLYLAEFNWIVEDRTISFRDAVAMCLRGHPIIRNDITDFSSPFLLRIVDTEFAGCRAPPTLKFGDSD